MKNLFSNIIFIVSMLFTLNVQSQCISIICPEDIMVEAESNECTTVVEYSFTTAIDSCVLLDTTFLNFSYTGDVQEFIIPDDVIKISFVVAGASGGYSSIDDNTQSQQVPGEGGLVRGEMDVLPGQIFNIYVGGVGGNSSDGNGGIGGYNGGGNGNFGTSYAGGGGGGASDLRLNGMNLTDRIVVAGGGGGSSYNFEDGEAGGNGGDLIGHDGFTGASDTLVIPGGGGSQTSGGVFGQYPFYSDGFPGELGIGGQGGYVTAGAGGGGGYYGGGGGSWNGGGGGSSFTEDASEVVHTQGSNIGDGYIILAYTFDPSIVVELEDGPNSESEFSIGTTSITLSASNENGETSTCSFDIIVTSSLATVTVSSNTITADQADAEYTWIDCSDDSIIEDETGQSFTPTENGSYAVTIDNGECIATSECQEIAIINIAENQNFSDLINVYPNPTSGKVEITMNPTISSGTYIIMDSSGRIVDSSVYNSSDRLFLDLSYLATGTYMLRVESNDLVINKRIIRN